MDGGEQLGRRLSFPDRITTEKQEEEDESVRQNYHISWPGIESHLPPLVTSTSHGSPGSILG